ncbi:MAG: threonine/serine exporter family protein [Rikenellaceae bacterium]|nr:threonine/serine exporter family protein [Rikenellaceae bacterium]
MGNTKHSVEQDEIDVREFAALVLDVGTVLMESGAHCDRIDRNVRRLAERAGFAMEIFFSFTAISLTVTDKRHPDRSVTAVRSVSHHGAHFGIVTRVSLLTWSYYEGEISFAELACEMRGIRQTPRHNPWLVRLAVGLACGCLCLLAGGDLTDGGFALAASTAGLWLRQTLVRIRYNLMVAILCSSFLTTVISGLDALLGLGANPGTAVATAVLFLIPGVPLINCIIDLVKGYYPTAVARGVFGSFVLLCIAVGMFVSMSLIGINYF